jgi:ribose transport system ATP-binding protein
MAHGSIPAQSGEVRRLAGARSGLVAPSRETQGSVADLPVLWNATLSALPRWRNPLRLLGLRSEREAAVEVLSGLNVRPSDPGATMGSLSGGNQQKVLFARTLLQQPTLFVLCEPTRGVDVRTRQEIYRLIEQLRDDGAAILVVTSDSEDLFSICDLVGVVSASGLSELWAAGDLSENQLAEVL